MRAQGSLELQVIASSPVCVLGTEPNLPQVQCHLYHQIISETTLLEKTVLHVSLAATLSSFYGLIPEGSE